VIRRSKSARARAAEKDRKLAATPPELVMDTNVFVDIHSCADVTEDFNRLYTTLGNAALDDPAITYRIARARESMLLAVYLHTTKSTSLALRHEAIGILERRSPPARGGTSMTADHTRVVAWFVKDYCLRGWNSVVTTAHGKVEGSAADRALVALAAEKSIPLVTTEGYSRDGSIDETRLIRREARAQGVTVLTPREYYAGKMDETAEIDAFLQRFYDRVPVYLERRGKRDAMHKLLANVHGFYRFVLRGEVEGRTTPVRVRVA
jgi:hypothetical protein